MSVRAKPIFAATSVRATAFTGHWMPVRPGITSGRPRVRSERLSSIRKTMTKFLPQLSAARLAQGPNAVFIAVPTAVTPGNGCCMSTLTPAPRTWRLTNPIPTSCSPVCGKPGAIHGTWSVVAPAADSICHAMAAIPGKNWRATVCRRVFGARSACGSQPVIPIAFTR